MVDLGILQVGDLDCTGFAMSAAGDVIVGDSGSVQTGFRAFRWTAATGMQPFPGLPTDTWSFATGVSADGSVIVGTLNGSQPLTASIFHWTAAGGLELFAPPSGWTSARASGISADGRVIVGTLFDQAAVSHAFRWTREMGFQDIGTLLGGDGASACATNADGSRIVGTSDEAEGSGGAFLWDASIDMVNLNEYLPSIGISLAGWELQTATAISADGLSIVGTGVHNGRTEAWLAELPLHPPPPPPAPCRANCNGDTDPVTGAPKLDIMDFVCFQNAYALGDLAKADVAGLICAPDGALSIQDFVCFQNLFALGCP